jgi:hypothetical protein
VDLRTFSFRWIIHFDTFWQKIGKNRGSLYTTFLFCFKISKWIIHRKPKVQTSKGAVLILIPVQISSSFSFLYGHFHRKSHQNIYIPFQYCVELSDISFGICVKFCMVIFSRKSRQKYIHVYIPFEYSTGLSDISFGIRVKFLYYRSWYELKGPRKVFRIPNTDLAPFLCALRMP